MKREDAINPAQDKYVYTSVSGRLQQIKHLLNYQRASIVDMIHAIQNYEQFQFKQKNYNKLILQIDQLKK